MRPRQQPLPESHRAVAPKRRHEQAHATVRCHHRPSPEWWRAACAEYPVARAPVQEPVLPARRGVSRCMRVADDDRRHAPPGRSAVSTEFPQTEIAGAGGSSRSTMGELARVLDPP